MDDIRWGRALVNGLFVWLVSGAMTLVPALVYILWRGVLLTQQGGDLASMGERISREVATLYAENWILVVGLIVIAAIVAFWRARVVAKGTWHMRWLNGLLVGVVPAALSLLSVLCNGLSLLDLVTVGLYLFAGLSGGILAEP